MQMTRTQTRPSDIASSDKVQFFPKKFLSEIWEEIELLLGGAINRGGSLEGVAEIKAQLLSGKYGLLAIKKETHLDAICVCDILKTYRGDIFRILYAAGDNINWNLAMKQTLEFAKSHGCVSIEITGRKGWERKLRRLGFVFKNITLGIDLCQVEADHSQQQQHKKPSHGTGKNPF